MSLSGTIGNRSASGRRRPFALLLALALVLGFLPMTVVAQQAWAASSSCQGGALNFSAHQDDDLLFMSPDILGDVSAGRCVRTVYVTAGDAGNGSDYWQSREKGSEAAWATMAGVSNSWTTSSISAGGKTLRLRTLTARPSISLVFMRLPDGDLLGTGYGSAGSVYRLLTGAVSSLTTKDSSASYTNTTLRNTFLDLMRASTPTVVRTQNYNGSYVASTSTSFDHWDHVAIAHVALDVSTAYNSESGHRRIAYQGYPTRYQSANVSGTLLQQKSDAFDAYADYDDEVDLSDYYNTYGWPSRQYVTATAGAAVVASAGADQSVLVNTTVTLDATGSYAGGTPSYTWTQTGGPSVTLSGASSAKPTFVPASSGTYVFKVTVSYSGTSSSDSVTVQASSVGTANLARLAGVSVTASSAATGQPATAVIDGSTLGWPTDYTKEWSTVSGKAGSWVKLTFPQAVATDRVVLYDRPNADDQITGCTLTFSDGSTVTCPSALDNAGGGTTITFSSRVTSSIQLTITAVGPNTQNIGLAEFEVYGTTSTAPIANAGSDQTTTVNQQVTLDGSGSTGSGTLTYAWALTTGPAAVTLSSASAVKPTFTPTVAGSYVFTLTVTANGQSSTSTVTVQVSAVGTTNVARLAGVVATASSGATNQTADRVIDGSVLGYPNDATKEWASVGQKGGAWVQLTFPQPVKTDTIVLYDRPNANDQVLSGTLTFSDGTTVAVGALDNTGKATTVRFTARLTTSVRFTVNTVSTTTVNVGLAELQVLGAVAQAPVANAGPDQSVSANSPVTLDGSASSEPNGMALTYVWTQTGGTPVALTGANTAKPTFTPTVGGPYTFQLAVSNGVATATDTVVITVSAVNRAPVASAGTAQSVVSGVTVTLDGSGSTDADGDALTYSWSQSAPGSPVVSLTNPNAAKPTFIAPGTVGDYTFQVLVSDGSLTSTASVTVTVRANTAPTANAGADQAVTVGDTVTLQGSGTDPDGGQTLSYVWEQTSPGSPLMGLSSAGVAKPTFTATTSGTYVFRLTVSDGQATGTDTVTITVNPKPNQAPVANAGADQSVTTGTPVTLDGSASSDPDGDPLTYAWTLQPGAPGSVTLTGGTTVNPSFTPAVAGTYTFQLTVSDNAGHSSTDTVTVAVGVPNRAPTANAGDDQTVNKGETVNLDGSHSSDIDGDALTYKWLLMTGPASVTLSSSTSAKPSFKPTVAGDYTFQLTVSDGTLAATDTVTITVKNRAPVASAGTAQSVVSGVTVTLDGSGSTDADGDALTYSWSQSAPGSPVVSLTNPNAAKPTFIAPGTVGDYTFQVLVSDGSLTSTASVTVTVRANTAPTANAGADQAVTVGDTVTLQGSGTDPDGGQTLSYVWEQTSPGSPLMGLSSAGVAKPTFTATTSGTYVFRLTVSDGQATGTDTVTITVNPKPNQAPVANAGAAQTVLPGATVTLDGSGSTDPDGQTLTYAWQQTSPASPLVTLSSATAAKPTFVPSTAGTYVFRLTVSDGTASSTATVTITVATAVNVARITGVTATASSQNTSTGQTAAKAIDGSTSGYPVDYTKEWATVGGKSGSWLQLTWSTPVTLNRIVLYDRPNANDRITAGTLVFSDGTSVPVTSLDNGGAATTFTFTARKVTSVRLNITSVATPSTENIGLAEIEAWGMTGG